MWWILKQAFDAAVYGGEIGIEGHFGRVVRGKIVEIGVLEVKRVVHGSEIGTSVQTKPVELGTILSGFTSYTVEQGAGKTSQLRCVSEIWIWATSHPLD